MNSLKKKFVAGGIVLVMATSAAGVFAKGGSFTGEGERKGGVNLDYIFTELALTDDQQTEVIEIITQLKEKNFEARAEAREARKEAREARKEAGETASEAPSAEERQAARDANRAAHMQELTDQLNTVLSADDVEDLVTYLDAHHGSREGERGDRNGKGERGGKEGRGNKHMFDTDSAVDESK